MAEGEVMEELRWRFFLALLGGASRRSDSSEAKISCVSTRTVLISFRNSTHTKYQPAGRQHCSGPPST